MTLEEWQQLMVRAHEAWRSGKRSDAIAEVDAITQRLETERSRDASEWEREQAFGLKASWLLNDDTRLVEAAESYLALARMQRGTMRAYRLAVGSSLANAAICLFKAGRKEEGFQIGEEAASLLGMNADTSQLFQDLIGHLNAFHIESAAKKQALPSKKW